MIAAIAASLLAACALPEFLVYLVTGRGVTMVEFLFKVLVAKATPSQLPYSL